jgi:hypothetical protein
VLERVIENWLTKVNERGFETAFTQLLIAEGYTVLHEPAHHPTEHGKDVVAVAPDGMKWAFQLKGEDYDLEKIGTIVPQLYGLVTSSFDYPGFAGRPDRTAFVTTGTLKPPARDRLRSFDSANTEAGLPPMELIEREQLVSRLSSAHSRYLPNDLVSIRKLLAFYLEDGVGPLPLNGFFDVIADAFKGPAGRSELQCTKAAASCGVIVSVALSPWVLKGNHVAVCQAWLAYVFQCLRLVEHNGVPDKAVASSVDMAISIVQEEVSALLADAEANDDLVIPDIVDGVVYPLRVLATCGHLAAGALAGMVSLERVNTVIKRELPFVTLTSEAGVPAMILMATTLSKGKDLLLAGQVVVELTKALSVANRRDSPEALADPYHPLDDELGRIMGMSTDHDDERYDGQAYTLHILLEWMMRRGLRQVVESVYADATKVNCCEFSVSEPLRLFDSDDPDGELRTWHLPRPGSWQKLSAAARVVSEGSIPGSLWRRADLLAFLPLLLPYRLTSDVAKAIDYWYLGLADVVYPETDQGLT